MSILQIFKILNFLNPSSISNSFELITSERLFFSLQNLIVIVRRPDQVNFGGNWLVEKCLWN